MKWTAIFMIFSGRRKSSTSRRDEADWLLSNSEAKFKEELESINPHSVQSSFRFELDSSSFDSSSEASVPSENLENDKCRILSVDYKMRRIESLEKSISSIAATLVRFSYGEIRSATDDFSRGRVLGRGALSCVYKGRLRFGRTVAIKRLVDEDKESAKAFCRELMIASSLHHKNVVPLIGFCIDQAGLFLVYKYIAGGSLEHHLHGEQKKNRGRNSVLSWATRYRVAIGVAQAVAYLHNGTDKCVIHRDIKPSNILLSSKMTPKLCDFGLATWTPSPTAPFLCKTVKGTFGYLAPEYFERGKVSDRMDVYAFGVVLLELITGRKPIEAKGTHADASLVAWAKPLLCHEGSIEQLIDPQLKYGSYDKAQLAQMARAAAACLSRDESDRPAINWVIAILRGDDRYTLHKSISIGKGYIHQHSQSYDTQKESLVKGHLALAMMGIMDL